MKITVYELLGLVKDGKAPKKIMFNNIVWNRVYGEKNVYYIDEYDNDLFVYFFRKILDFTLNDEVEILKEEKKIPEKINEENSIWEEQARDIDYYFKNTINDIVDYLDYLKSKGDE